MTRGAPPCHPQGAYSVPEGVAADGVLGGKGGAAQHDEDQDEVGENVVVDELVAAHADPVGKATAWTQPQEGPGRQAGCPQHLGPPCGDGSGRGQPSLGCPHLHPTNWNHRTLSPLKF